MGLPGRYLSDELVDADLVRTLDSLVFDGLTALSKSVLPAAVSLPESSEEHRVCMAQAYLFDLDVLSLYDGDRRLHQFLSEVVS